MTMRAANVFPQSQRSIRTGDLAFGLSLGTRSDRDGREGLCASVALKSDANPGIL
jgi:hypothetical protein